MLKTSSVSRKRGRPNKSEDLRDVILDKAELAFAEFGFEGASTRDIARRADVNQALLRYYFGSKAELFDACFKRRGHLLAEMRQANLDKLLQQDPSPSVEALIYAYLSPQWDMKHSGPNGAAFVALQARLHAEPEEHALRLRREVYDASVKRYIRALADALPDVPAAKIPTRMAFLVGSYLFMLNDLGRIDDLTDGDLQAVEKDDMLHELVAFLAAGMRAVP